MSSEEQEENPKRVKEVLRIGPEGATEWKTSEKFEARQPGDAPSPLEPEGPDDGTRSGRRRKFSDHVKAMRRGPRGAKNPKTPEELEAGWGRWTPLLAVLGRWMVLVLVVAAGITGWRYLAGRGDPQPVPHGRAEDEPELVLARSMAVAEEVAQAFLAESEPARRLPLVRDADAVREHLGSYSEEALRGRGKIQRVLGHREGEDGTVTGFVVEFPGGTFRMLEVVETPAGLRVDWDGFARYCSARWEDLLEGAVTEAEVRVFLSPGFYHNPPFADAREWTCFQLQSPDLPYRVHAFTRRGTQREQRLRQLVLDSGSRRQHMTLRLVRHAGLNNEPLFEIVRAVAAGWVKGSTDLEQQWAEDGESSEASGSESPDPQS